MEQELEALSESIDDSPASRLGGVNGFGTVPFTIQSRREIKIHSPEKNEDEWSRILGL
jgi:hypothetical protein